MKLRLTFFIPAIFCFVFLPAFAQEKPVAVLHDEFGKLCSEDLMARYDGYMVRLNSDPSATGYFVFYGAENFEGRNVNFINFLKDMFPDSRKFDKSRLVLQRGENRPEMLVQFWVVPAGAEVPKPAKEFVQEKIVSAMRFDKSPADFNKEYGGALDIYYMGFHELGCEFSVNRREFAKTLSADPKLTGYLIVYTKFGRGAKRGNQVAAFAVRDLVKNYKVPRNRLKTIYGGNREEPEIELWLAPKNDKPPVPKPDSRPKK